MADTESVVEFSTLEREKENITATRNGHSALALQQTFSVPRNQRQQQLAAAKARFAKEIEEAHADSPDPLDAYVRFVKWTVDSYPSGKSADSGLVPLLELATRTFKDEPAYRLDLRYLNLWIQYAHLVAKPELVFAYLIANDIGQCYAVLYDEYAQVLERQGSRTKADEIYRLGIARKAKPAALLQTRYDAFMARMLTAGPGASADADPELSASGPPVLGGRKVLGDRSAGGRSQAGASQTATLVQSQRATTGNRGKLSVFVDGENGPHDYATNDWIKLETQGSIDKENDAQPTAWVGERLHQPVSQTPRTPKFSVLKDGDPDDMGKGLPHKTPDRMSIRPPSERPLSEAELLFNDPFKNYTDPPIQPSASLPEVAQHANTNASTSSSLGASVSASTRTRGSFPKPKPFIPPEPVPLGPNGKPVRKPEKYMFHLSLLWNEGEQKEYTAAEARAKSQGLLLKKWPAPPLPVSAPPGVHFEPLKPDGGARRASMAREPTVTINTKFAMNDVFDMFNGAGEDEDSFEDDGASTVPQTSVTGGPNKVPTSASKDTEPPTPTPFGRSTNSSFKPFVDNTPVSKPKVTATPRFTPFVDAPSDVPAAGPTPGPNRSSMRSAHDLQRSTSGPALHALTVVETKPTRTPRFTPFVDPPSASDNLPPQSSALELSSTSGPTPLRSKAGPSFRPFVDPSSVAEVPATPTPLGSKAAESAKVLAHPSPVQEEAEDFENGSDQPEQPPAKALKPKFDIFRDIVPPKRSPEVPNESRKSSEEMNIFLGATENIFEQKPNEKPESRLSNSSAARPFNTLGEARKGLQERPVQDVFGGPGEAVGDSGDSDWSEEEAVDQQLPPNDQAEEQYEDDDLDDLPPYKLGRFPRIHEMTPITERTYEFTRTSSEFTMNGRRSSIAPPGNDTNLPEEQSNSKEPSGSTPARLPRKSVARPRQSVAKPRQSVAPQEFTVPNPCNPFEDQLLELLLDLVGVGFVDLRSESSGQLERLQRFGAKKLRNSTDKKRSSSAPPETLTVTLGEGDTLEVHEKLGEGGFGAVFLASLGGYPAAGDATTEVEYLALKAVKPCQLWEYSILVHLREFIPEELLPSIIQPHVLYAYKDESYLVISHYPHGTLLDCVNRSSGTDLGSSTGDGFQEILVAFFAIELFRVIEGLHANGFVHGDLKIDNCLVRLTETPEDGSPWSARYDPSGANGWASQGICLIDFGRAIDTNLFPPGQMFCGDWPTDARDCVEMREGRPWTYETDYFGLAGIIYCMLFKKYIETTAVVDADGNTRYKIATPLKRYWNIALWNRVFDVLLNPKRAREDHALPIPDEIAILRDEMEQWLVENCNKGGKNLKALLKKILMWAM